MGTPFNYDELARQHGGKPKVKIPPPPPGFVPEASTAPPPPPGFVPESPEKIVQVPGVGNVSFPGGMADSAISEAIKRHLAKQSVDYDALAAQHGGQGEFTNVRPIAEFTNVRPINQDEWEYEPPKDEWEYQSPAAPKSAFQNLSLADKNQYLLKNSPTFAKMPPKDRSEYLNKIHYGPAAKPAEDTSSIWGGMKSALGEQARGMVGELKKPLSYLPMPGPLSMESQISAVRSHYPLIRRAAQETWEGMKHPLTPPAPLAGLHRAEALMPIAGSMAAGVEEPAMAGRTREAIGRGLVYGSELAAPVLGGRLLKAIEPARGHMAERVAQSVLGPEPRGTPPVSRPAPAVVAEGPVALSRKGGILTRGLIGKLDDSLAKHEATIQRTLRASKGAPPEPLAPIVDTAVGPEIVRARAAGRPEVAARIENWRNQYLWRKPASVSLDELHELRKSLGKDQAIFKGAKASAEDIGLDQARREVYRAMNEALDRRMPGFRDVTERQSGLIRAKQMLKEQSRREAGGPLLPSPRLYGGESAGGGFMAMRFGLGIPGETLAKTLAVKALGKRLPLAEPTPAPPFVATPTPLAPPLGPPEPGAITPPRTGGMSIERLKALSDRLGAERMAAEGAAPVSPLGRGTLARLPEKAAPPETRATLPGLGQAVLENRAAAERFRGQELGREFNAPRENVSAATGEMERESPLFRETGAGGQEGLFAKAETARPAPAEAAKAAPQGAALGPVLNVPRESILADPQRFQFRTELSRAMRSAIETGDAKFKPELSEGPITFWKDPADGKPYVVDGHHRLEIARRSGTAEIEARELNAPNVQTARAFGAYRNIASGHASAIDVAKFMRDTGIGPDHLAQQGISLGSKLVTDGSRLANLDDSIFDQVVTGKLPERTGTAIAQIADKAAQRGMLDLLKRKQANGSGLSYPEIEALARRATLAGTTETTGGLFGSVSESNAVEVARMEAYVRNRLSSDKRLFGFVSKGERPAELSRAGNVIKVPESKAIAENARHVLDVFDRLISYKGPINDAINEGAAAIQRGAGQQAARENTYQRVQGAVAQELRETQ